MHALHHKVKIIIHLMINHLSWVEGKDVKAALKDAKEAVQKTLIRILLTILYDIVGGTSYQV